MKLQDQVCSLELAIKLKKLGVPQSGAFDYYENTFHPHNPFIVLRPSVNLLDNPTNWICCAFTSAELGEILPKERFPIWDYREKCWVVLDGSKWKTEADSRAKMLIYLLEKKLIKQQSFITKEISRDKLYDDLCSVYSLSICDRNAVMSQVDILIEQERLKQNACRNKS